MYLDTNFELANTSGAHFQCDNIINTTLVCVQEYDPQERPETHIQCRRVTKIFNYYRI